MLDLVLGKEMIAAGFDPDEDDEAERVRSGGGGGSRLVAEEEAMGLDFDPPSTRCCLGLGEK